jgi:hypothetical protein
MLGNTKWRVFAFNRTTGAPVTGDAANITAKISIDYGSRTALSDVNPAEAEDGYYYFDLTEAERTGTWFEIYPESSTSGVQVIGVPGYLEGSELTTDEKGYLLGRYEVPPPADLGFTPPIKIYRYDGNWFTDLEIETYKVPATATYYLSPQGNDANSGLSLLAPKRSISALLATLNASPPAGATLYLAPGYYSGADSINGLNIAFPCNIICPEGNATMGHFLTFTFNKLGGYNFIYRSAYSGGTDHAVIDLAWLDEYGVARRMRRATSRDNCDATPGTYWTSGGNLFEVHMFDDRAPDSNLVAGANSGGSWAQTTATNIYMEGVRFWGCWVMPTIAIASGTAAIALNRIEFGYGPNSREGLKVDSASGVSIITNDCKVHYNDTDGFDWDGHATDNSCQVTEVSTAANWNGWRLTGTADNGSTAHKTVKIVRVNGDYLHNHDRNVHDIESARSWNIGCIAGPAYNDDTDAYDNIAWAFGRSGQADATQAWLYDCDFKDGSVADLGCYGSAHVRLGYGDYSDWVLDGDGTITRVDDVRQPFTQSVAATISSAGVGEYGVTITVEDGSSNLVGGIAVEVLDSNGARTGIWGYTTSLGTVEFSLNAGEYQFTVALQAGYESHTPQSLTVAEDGETLTLEVTRQSVSVPYVGTSALGKSDPPPKTLADIVSYVMLAVDAAGTDIDERKAVLAAQESVRQVTLKHAWSFNNRRVPVVVNAPYSTGTVTVSGSTVTLAGGTWPEWAQLGVFTYTGDGRTDGRGWRVRERVSSTVLTLEGAPPDAASGAAYSLAQVVVQLPDQLRDVYAIYNATLDQPIEMLARTAIHMQELWDDVAPSDIRAATITVNHTTGKKFLSFSPPPDETTVITVDGLYDALPAERVIRATDARVAISGGIATITGATVREGYGDMLLLVGSGTAMPTPQSGWGHKNPVVEPIAAYRVRQRISSTQVELYGAADVSVTNRAFILADVVDYPHHVFLAIERFSEAAFARMVKRADYLQRETMAEEELRHAIETDSQFGNGAGGRRRHYRVGHLITPESE